MIYDFIILGAGISGLNTAKAINQADLGSLLVLEKSRGVGGRLATRRTLDTRFDHGAQFYKLKTDALELHQSWQKECISHKWFLSDNIEFWCANDGMTSLAKSLANNIFFALEKQIRTISFENDLWKLTSDKEEIWFCHNLIISSPLPQTIKLLEGVDDLHFLNKNDFNEISKITYTKALIGLITLSEDYIHQDHSGYQEFKSGDLFSISDQKVKGISLSSALTITMSAEFSEREFDNSEDLITKAILESLKLNLPNIKIKEFELKKWRYCKPLEYYSKPYLEICTKLYLIGDAFGGASIAGALRSSTALSNFLKTNISKKALNEN